MEVSSEEGEIPIPINTHGIPIHNHHHHNLNGGVDDINEEDEDEDELNNNNNTYGGGYGIGYSSSGSWWNNTNNKKTKKKKEESGGVIKYRYRECQKNHAASMGGNVRDGCGEFMPSGQHGSLEALTCSACQCHRNFHRKHPILTPPPNNIILPSTMIIPHHHYSSSNKRFRTKFTQEQKMKMLAFAHRVGWKLQNQQDSVVQQFCQQIGVNRRVLKVWMHNNKHNLATSSAPTIN